MTESRKSHAAHLSRLPEAFAARVANGIHKPPIATEALAFLGGFAKGATYE